MVSTIIELCANPELGDNSFCMRAEVEEERIRASFRLDTDLGSKGAVGIQQADGRVWVNCRLKLTTWTKIEQSDSTQSRENPSIDVFWRSSEK